MKRSDVWLKEGDAVVVHIKEENVTRGGVVSKLGGNVWVQFAPTSSARFNPDGTKTSGRALVTHVNGVAIDDEPRLLAYDASLDKVRTSLSDAKNTALKVATLTDKMAAALRQFCARVEAGEIRSVETYVQFKQLLAEYEALS